MSIRASIAYLVLALAMKSPQERASTVSIVSRGSRGPAATSSRSKPAFSPSESARRNASRRVVATKLRMVWQIGGDADDTTIMMPLQVRATREHFVVYDAIALRLLGVTPATGKIVWRFGRPGRGPDEFSGVAKVTARREGGTFVVDMSSSRLTLVTEDGKGGERVDYKMGVNPRGVCEAGNSRIQLRATEGKELERTSLSTGRAVAADLPWPELREVPSLARQSKIFEHPKAGVCLVSITYGPMFAILDDSGVRARARWIEEIPMGQAKSLGKGSWEMLPSVKSAQGVTGIGDSFAVLFRGRGPKRGRFVDFYSVTDAAYLFSIELPFAPTDIAYGHGLLVLSGESEDGAPFVRAYSVAPALDGLVRQALTNRAR